MTTALAAWRPGVLGGVVGMALVITACGRPTDAAPAEPTVAGASGGELAAPRATTLVVVDLDFVTDTSIPGGRPVFPMYLAADGTISLGERGEAARSLGRVSGVTFEDRDGRPLWRLDGDTVVDLDEPADTGRFEGDSTVVIDAHRFTISDDGLVSRDGTPFAARFRGIRPEHHRTALCLIVQLVMFARRAEREAPVPGSE